MLSRRQLLKLSQSAFALAASAQNPIARRSLVTRHNPSLDRLDAASPLSVGNGEFTFTADITGLQSFPGLYEKTTPLTAQSQWGWHSFPNPKNFSLAAFRPTVFNSHGRAVPYPIDGKGQEESYNWLRENPHRLNLAAIGFQLARVPESPAQSLDLWTGLLRSSFEVDNARAAVETCCHPTLDLLAVRASGQLTAVFEFPYGSPGMNASDWTHPERHASQLSTPSPNNARIARTLDGDRYAVSIAWRGSAALKQEDTHRFALYPAGDALEFTCWFTREPPAESAPSVAQTQAAAAEHWQKFWTEGAALELAHAPDPRAKELERRIVLSQYLTAIQCAGSLPPQETGLTCNSWNGKFHMEMYLWHAAHFALWNRPHLLERSMGFYHAILASARNTAKLQGYAGARWPKMTAADGRESPSPIGPLLIWQQPHPIWMAEALYQTNPTRRTLDRYAEIVLASADFMASYPYYDQPRARYVLGPPIIPAQENHPARETWNPTFELEYWAWGLRIAALWRHRLGLPAIPKWDAIRTHLSALPVQEGVYLAHENCPQTYVERNRDHPSMLAALGLLPGAKVDRETMRRTLHKVLQTWKFPDTWGWDYPVIAMTAAALGEPDTAIDALLLDTPKNRWSPNGHTFQRPGLPVYLPSNGALLLGAAKMAGNGFPPSWKIRSEGLRFIE